MHVFITGASSGIGRALALHYANRGASLGLSARRASVLQTLVDQLGTTRAAAYGADVRDAAAMQTAAQAFMERFGVPDIVFANAGISHGTQTGQADDLRAFQDIIDTNLLGIVRTFQPFVAPMRAAGNGQLVGITSVAGVRGLPGAGAYSASKAAASNYLESLRVELRASGVQVITVMPGFIATPMTQANPYPMPFILTAEDCAGRIARAVAHRRREVVIPWQMAIVARLLRWLPPTLYDALAAQAPRKPRRS